jgi:hypothetical protein
MPRHAGSSVPATAPRAFEAAPVTLFDGSTFGSRTTTEMSRHAPRATPFKRALRLAWQSLALVSLMPLLQSCIVADPPAYRAPVRTQPLLDSYKSVPLPQQLLVVYTTDQVGVSISVPVRSEDAGEDLQARFFLDYGVPSLERPLRGQRIPASTYDDTSRSASYDKWLPRTTSGCHLLTLVVAHVSSYQLTDQDHLNRNTAGDDAATLTWLVNVNPAPDQVNTLVNCPTPVLPVQ